VRRRIIAGVLVVVPIFVTGIAIEFLVGLTADVIRPLTRLTVGRLPPTAVWAVSAAIVLVALYAVGAVATHVVGHKLIAAGEALLLRIPLVKTIYAATKKVVETLTLPNRSSFKAVVSVDFPRPGMQVVGFVTGIGSGRDGRRTCRVFVPTTPNPTSGFLFIVPEDEVTELDMSVEEAVKMVVSGGILSPDALRPKRGGVLAPGEADLRGPETGGTA
jgi:uncharacterized membrane protein